MKILTICSTLDFINHPRRATIEAIHRLNPELDILLFNSILNIYKPKLKTININYYYYHFWVLESFRKIKLLEQIEYIIRRLYWKRFFKKYDIIFLIDPNQYYLIPYFNDQKVIYLLRDPSILQNPAYYKKELRIIIRSQLILGISKMLCTYYFNKYYGFIPENVHYWPNTVDLSLWDYNKWKFYRGKNKKRPIAGLSGNINFVNDLDLLEFIVKDNPEIDFEIAGKIQLEPENLIKFNTILKLTNINHLGFIPFDEFPKTVINWDVGLVIADLKNEYARYLNNNKQYQYIAFGKPFVTFRLNADYDEFEDFVYLADDYQSFSYQLKKAINLGKSLNIEKGIAIANKHSAIERANQFFQLVNQ